MRCRFALALLCSMILAGRGLQAADVPTTQPKPLMADLGQSLLVDDFAGPTLSPEWKIAKGKWEIVNGALKGVEKSEDMHAAVVRHDLKTHNLVAQFSFRFDGAKSTAFSVNNSKGHVCRVSITAAGFNLLKDKPGKNSTEKGALLEKVACPIKAGEWHTMLVEICGKEMVASIDDQKIIGLGSNDGIDADKTNFGFPVAGEGASFKNLKVWDATVKADWEQTRAKLTAAKEKQAAAK